MQTQERDNTIIESVQHASPLLRQVACLYRQDYDDLYQIAAETVLNAYSKAQQKSNSGGYLYRAIRYTIMKYVGASCINKRAHTLADHYLIQSLDAPLIYDNDTFSLCNLVSETSSTSQETRDFSRLYAALDSLPKVCRMVICMRFGLCGYGAHRPCEIARILGIRQGTVDDHIQRAKAILREYTELLELVSSRA